MKGTQSRNTIVQKLMLALKKTMKQKQKTRAKMAQIKKK